MDVARSERGRSGVALLAALLAVGALWAGSALASGGSSGGSGGPASVPAQSQGGAESQDSAQLSGTAAKGSHEDCPFKDGQQTSLDPAV